VGDETKMRFLIALSLFMGAAFAAPMNLNGKKIVSSENIYTLAQNRVQILMFGVEWCPPCRKSRELIEEAGGKFGIAVTIVDTDKTDKKTLTEFGVGSRIPFILVADKSGAVVKRFEATPNKVIFFELIKRLNEDRLENGVPPVTERDDLWKKSRYDK
jgi:thiol-disulfide isomerase/thioredoxin